MTDFTTKDSGKREEYASGMVRDTQEDKPDFTNLIIPGVPLEEQPIVRLVELYMRGAGKYGRANWMLADSEEELRRFEQSGFRHHWQYLSGDRSEDHGMATCWNIIAAEYLRWKLANKKPS